MILAFESLNNNLADTLATTYADTLAIETERLAELTKLIELQEAQLTKTDDAWNDRVRINDKYAQRIDSLREALEKARTKFGAAEQKKQDLSLEGDAVRSELRSLKRRAAEQADTLSSTAVYGATPARERFQQVATVIRSVAPYLDPGHSIEISPNKFVFTTAPIHIYDRDGSIVPVNFGRFEVTMLINANRRFWSEFKPLEPIYNDDYFHPHVDTNRMPCLGNAQSMLFQALKDNAFGLAVSITWEFLTNYNILSPYRTLECWSPCKWHTAMCSCGLVMRTQCGCDGCSSCRSSFPSTDLGPCGLCPRCCGDHHDRLPSALNGLGVQGSNCGVRDFLSVRSIDTSQPTTVLNDITNVIGD